MCFRKFLLFALISFAAKSYAQQDVAFHLSNTFLPGKSIIKVKRDFYDPYVWVLARNNEVYRINSQSFVIDDYTSHFASYSGFQFVDIAGTNQDTVFIATNSTNVIQYKKGATRLIGAADGVPGTVNSVGIANGSTITLPGPRTLMVGTGAGFRVYDIESETISNGADNGKSKVYEATWRTEMFKDSSANTSNPNSADTIRYLPAVFKPTSYTTVVNYLWEGGHEFGYDIHTAECIFESLYDYNSVFTNLFWGNSRGMFQNYANYSNDASFTNAGHYLNGINVNKITNIFGLTSFGSGEVYEPNTLVKQNLLIGTDNGFYFSSSIYTGSPAILRTFLLFHFDELGNIRVNDICVNMASITKPICEDGVWLACDNGLYFLRPDYGQFLNNPKLNAVSFKDMSSDISSLNICAGTTATATVNSSVYTGHTLQWYKDGRELAGQTSNDLLINGAGDYYAVAYDPCGNYHLESNHLKVQVISAPVFSFNYPGKLQYCDSTQTTLRTDDNPGYHYRWYSNGVLNGDTTFNYTVVQSGKYKVEVSACSGSWVPSKEIEVDLISLPVPVITSDKTSYCTGGQAILTVNTPVDPGYTINWYKDGKVIPADQDKTSITATIDGSYAAMISSKIASCSQTSNAQQITFTPVPVFTFNYPDELRYCSGTPVTLKAEGDPAYQYRWYKNDVLTGDTRPSLSISQRGKYKVEVSSCEGSWIPSKEVQVDVINLPIPSIGANKPAYCIGDNATLSITAAADPSYTINWYKDNVLQSAYTNQTSITTMESGNYSVSIVNNQANTDGSTCSQSSAIQTVVFNPPPTASIQKIVGTTLCDGQTVDLKVSYNTGTVTWSTGQTGDQVSVKQSGTYKATITSTAGCSIEVSEDVQFFPNPALNIPNTAVCVPSHKMVTLTAPPGMVSYIWNGQQGTNTYVADHPQTLTLTVTDANGCQATQDIQVADECPEVRIPNAFTPNGDGINDTWDIVGLEYDPTALVRIFTRYGQQVFESKGYGTPWNGEYRGKKLPTGAYYYIISAKNSTQTFSGEVTIIY